MATEYTWYVDPDVVGGAGDGTSWANAYTTLNAALAAKAKNLVTADEIYIFECRSSGGSADTTGVLILGWTTDSTRYVITKATSGHEALKTGLDTSRYRLDNELQCRAAYTRVQGLQLLGQAAASAFYAVVQAGTYYLENCRIEIFDNSVIGIRCNNAGATIIAYNTIIDNKITYGDNGVEIDAGTVNLYNCIVRDCIYGVLVDPGATFNAKNTAIFDCTDDINNSGTANIDYCASDDGDGTNAVAPSGGDWDNEYLDSANGDFTLVSGGNCEGGGTDDPSSGLYSTDMDGDAYSSPWSIGVDAKTGGGTVYELAGNLVADLDVGGILNMNIVLYGGSEISLDVSSALTMLQEIVAGCENTSDVSALITAIKELEAGTETSLDVGSLLNVLLKLAGGTESGLDVSSALSIIMALNGGAEISLDVSGIESFIAALSASASISLDASGVISGLINVSGGTETSVSTSALLNMIALLVGDSEVSIDVSADLTELTTMLKRIYGTVTLNDSETGTITLTTYKTGTVAMNTQATDTIALDKTKTATITLKVSSTGSVTL